MRHVDHSQVRRFAKQKQLDALTAAQKALSDAASVDDRRAYIDANGKVWSELRHVLWQVGAGKCWYSEAIIEADAGEVEHFRPKKQVWKSKPTHSGYWWRAFDWRNFRLAHPLVNKRRPDYSTEKQAGKGCYFPLRSEASRATNANAEPNEEPSLLDPTIASERSHLFRFQ